MVRGARRCRGRRRRVARRKGLLDLLVELAFGLCALLAGLLLHGIFHARPRREPGGTMTRRSPSLDIYAWRRAEVRRAAPRGEDQVPSPGSQLATTGSLPRSPQPFYGRGRSSVESP